MKDTIHRNYKPLESSSISVLFVPDIRRKDNQSPKWKKDEFSGNYIDKSSETFMTITRPQIQSTNQTSTRQMEVKQRQQFQVTEGIGTDLNSSFSTYSLGWQGLKVYLSEMNRVKKTSAVFYLMNHNLPQKHTHQPSVVQSLGIALFVR